MNTSYPKPNAIPMTCQSKYSTAKSILNKFFGSIPRKPSKRSASRQAGPSYDTLEGRNLLASIFLNSSAGDLYVGGDSDNNVALVYENTAANRVTVTMDDIQSRSFDRTDINRVIFIGLNGNDTFTNRSSVPSLILGGNGNDKLYGGSEADRIVGGRGDDFIDGGFGNDSLVGSFGNDEIEGGLGNDRIFGSAGSNTLRGEGGNDVIYGSDERDRIFGGIGADRIYALGGDDYINLGDGGISGTSNLDFAIGGDGDDYMTGGLGVNVFYGGNGNDEINGGTYGRNRMHGQHGNDKLFGGRDRDYLNGGFGNDEVYGSGGNDYMISGFGNDKFNGGTGIDMVKFTGAKTNYRVTGSSEFTIRDQRNTNFGDGVDTSLGVDFYGFTNGFFTPQQLSIGGNSGSSDESGPREYLDFNQSGRANDNDTTSNSRKLYRMETPSSGSYRVNLGPLGTTLRNPIVEVYTSEGRFVARGRANSRNVVDFRFNASSSETYHLNVLGQGTNGYFSLFVTR